MNLNSSAKLFNSLDRRLSFLAGRVRCMGHPCAIPKPTDSGSKNRTQTRMGFGLHQSGLTCKSFGARMGRMTLVSEYPESSTRVIAVSGEATRNPGSSLFGFPFNTDRREVSAKQTRPTRVGSRRPTPGPTNRDAMPRTGGFLLSCRGPGSVIFQNLVHPSIPLLKLDITRNGKHDTTPAIPVTTMAGTKGTFL